jgi:hypothetical protein
MMSSGMVLPNLFMRLDYHTDGLAMFWQESPAHVSGRALNKDLSNKASLTFRQKTKQMKNPKRTDGFRSIHC